jgi:hypothetical protein
MAIAHSSSTTSQTANTNVNTSLSVTGLSTSSANLNVVHLVGFAEGTDVNPTMTTPSGWTKLGETLETGGLSNTTWSAVYWKFGNGATSQTFSWSNAGQMVAVASVYTGVDATTPIPDYNLEVKGTTNTSYTVSVTTTGAGWIVSGFGNRSGHTFSALADTSRGTATLTSASSIVVQDSAADVSSGSITRTATGSGSTANGAEWVFRLMPDAGGGGVAHTLTITDSVGLAETGESVLGVIETITDTVGLTDSTVRVHTPGSITTPTTAPDFTALIEIAFDDTPRSSAPVYTDVAEYVRASSIPSMSRGRSNEFDAQAQAGRASLEFVNTDDDLTVGNTSSPFDPLQIRRPFRVRLAYGGNVYPVWAGYVDSWENGRDETTGIVQMQASDRLARAASVRLKGLVSAEILADSPTAYYPLNDDGASLTAGDQSTVIGNPPMSIGGNEDNDVAFGVGAAPGPDAATVVAFTVGGAT